MARTPAPPKDAAGLALLILASPRLSSALATVSIGTAVLSYAIRQTIGWAGLIGILSGLVVLTMASLAAQWKQIEWRGLLPLSLLVFVGWAAVSIFWSQYQWTTLAGLAYLAAFTLLGIYIALARDTIQIVRAFGDVLRVVLGVSLGLEIFSGLLIDTPIRFLGITGDIGNLGPIQGLLGTRNQLGLLAVLALVTFATEMLTRSVTRGRAVFSLILAAVTLLLTRAPLAFGALIIMIVAAAVVYGLRRAPAGVRPYLQVATLVATVAIAIIGWVNRGAIVHVFNAAGDLNYRLGIWNHVFVLIQQFPLQGWGWVGMWHDNVEPFAELSSVPGRISESALNGYLDVWFQLGLVGFLLFLGFMGLTFTRSWLLASRRRNVVFAWPALVLVVLLVGALAESSILVEFGWLSLVVCSVKASHELSWRRAFRDEDETAAPGATSATDR
jgi:O-antigen ligase